MKKLLLLIIIVAVGYFVYVTYFQPSDETLNTEADAQAQGASGVADLEQELSATDLSDLDSDFYGGVEAAVGQ